MTAVKTCFQCICKSCALETGEQCSECGTVMIVRTAMTLKTDKEDVIATLCRSNSAIIVIAEEVRNKPRYMITKLYHPPSSMVLRVKIDVILSQWYLELLKLEDKDEP